MRVERSKLSEELLVRKAKQSNLLEEQSNLLKKQNNLSKRRGVSKDRSSEELGLERSKS